METYCIRWTLNVYKRCWKCGNNDVADNEQERYKRPNDWVDLKMKWNPVYKESKNMTNSFSIYLEENKSWSEESIINEEYVYAALLETDVIRKWSNFLAMFYSQLMENYSITWTSLSRKLPFSVLQAINMKPSVEDKPHSTNYEVAHIRHNPLSGCYHKTEPIQQL